MATATVTKNILLVGHSNQGKTTLRKALKTVLEARYGLGEEVDEMDSDRKGYFSDKIFQFTIDNCCYRILDIPMDELQDAYLERHWDEIDLAVYVCSISSIKGFQDYIYFEHCKRHGIFFACVYMSGVTEDADAFMIECLDADADKFIGPTGHPNTAKLTQSLNKSYSATAPLMQSKNVPILHGDSELAIKDPFGPYGDVMVRLIHYIKAALFG